MAVMVDPTAKALFMKYDGNTFHMRREGEYDIYKAFQVPREMEILWIRELRDTLLRELVMRPFTAPHASHLILRYLSSVSCFATDYSAVNTLIEAIAPRTGEFDSFLKLRCAEDVIHACEAPGARAYHSLPAARDFAERLLREVLENPIVVADEWQQEPHLPDTFSEEAIKRRALKAYEEAMCT
jgi:hypothetical protein